MSLDERSILDLEGERQKQCPKCGGTSWYIKPAERKKLAYNGKRYDARAHPICLTCKRERWKRYYQENKKKVLRKNREWYRKNPEKQKEYSAKSKLRKQT